MYKQTTGVRGPWENYCGADCMYLSKLKIHGFKSFALPTDLNFDPGITAIVGPNGCGKSNVVDAIRWVIGEQRARILRSEKMENVIFNGASKRRPLGMAEVELTVENTRGMLPIEYAEVTLGRRLYRSGDSEYLLNGTACRLRDIVDLFMDTGMGAGAYSVIELKMIEEILSDNAQDRRRLFEEAAGVTKYKQRRAQTLRRLGGTQDDLLRLRDVTGEIERQVRSLRRQAAAAARQRELKLRAVALESQLAQVEFDRITQEQARLATCRQELTDRITAQTARLRSDQAEQEALRKLLVDEEFGLTSSERRFHEHVSKVQRLEAELSLQRERLAAATSEQDRTVSEIEEAKTRVDSLAAEREVLVRLIAEAGPAREEAVRLRGEARTARDLLRSETEARLREIKELQRRERASASRRERRLRQVDRIVSQLDRLAAEEKRLRTSQDSLTASRRETKRSNEVVGQRLKLVTAELGEARDRRDAVLAVRNDLKRRKAETTRRLLDLRQRYAVKTSERNLLSEILRTYEDFPDAVRFLTTSSIGAEPLPTVSDILTCPDSFRAALDAALDGLGACLVAETDQQATRAFKQLRTEAKGRARFVIMERLRGLNPIETPSIFPEESVALASVVTARSEHYASLVDVLLENVFVVSSLEEAEALLGSAKDRVMRFVTQAGEWVDTRGFVHAGSGLVKPSPGAERMARRDRLDRTLAELKTLRDDEAVLRDTAAALAAELEVLPIDEADVAVKHCERRLRDIHLDRVRAQEAQSALAQRQREGAERLGELELEKAALIESADEAQQAAREAEDTLEQVRLDIEAAEVRWKEADLKRQGAEDTHLRAGISAHAAVTHHTTMERDLNRVRSTEESVGVRVRARIARTRELETAIKAAYESAGLLQLELSEERLRRKAHYDSVVEGREKVMQIRSHMDGLRVRIRRLRRELEESRLEDSARAHRETEISARLGSLLTRARDHLDIDLEMGTVDVAHDFDEATARREAEAVRAKLKSTGSVNELALEEYEVHSERLEEMTAQCADLEQAEATLQRTISEINATARERFTTTYEAIRSSFRSLFKELFGGEASADLLFDDKADPLEAPIEIVATPRGKRPIHIAQLSSGEKTLTAIALLFAIYLVKPSPFCFLDEVDAPLDDANIDRYMRLVRRFSLDTQFILVTHNKRTMEMADRLYGITMQERGVSRMVGVQFEEAMQYARQN